MAKTIPFNIKLTIDGKEVVVKCKRDSLSPNCYIPSGAHPSPVKSNVKQKPTAAMTAPQKRASILPVHNPIILAILPASNNIPPKSPKKICTFVKFVSLFFFLPIISF